MTRVFDGCLGHVDSQHTYHYHLPPTCLLNSLNGSADSSWWADGSWPDRGRPSPLIGWALDGWPIFGPYDASGRLMTNATLDRCNGKRLPDGSYAYFTTPTGGVACFVGRPGSAANRGLQQPARRCPRRGTGSAYCAGPAGACPPVAARGCERCEAVYFIFPACPAADETAVIIARVFGVFYSLTVVGLVAWGPAAWANYRRNTEAAARFAVSSQNDQAWRPSDVVSLSKSEASIAAKVPEVPWTERLLKWLGFSDSVVEAVEQARKAFNARAMQSLRALAVICVSRTFFLLIDPWHAESTLPAWLSGMLYGVVYPSLNWSFVQSAWILALRSGMATPRKRPWAVRFQVLITFFEFFVQSIADLLRASGLAPSEHSWLMMCQIYFLLFSFGLAVSFGVAMPLLWKSMRRHPARAQHEIRKEFLVLVVAMLLKVAHTLFAAIDMLPGNLCKGIPVWAQLFIKEMFVFWEFFLLSAFIILTVHHASK